MKFWLIFLATILTLPSCLSDLRPKDLRDSSFYTEEMNEEGRRLLAEFARVSGVEKWQSVESYQIYMNDDFYGLIGKWAQPFGQKRNQFKLDFYPQENAGSLLFLNGKHKGQVWGYNEGNAFIKERLNEPPKDVDKKAIKFWIPTYQYLLEFPFRISNADVIYHVGEEKYGLNLYDKVLVSWKTTAPQRKLDQYMLWINKSTKLVDKLQFTVRDQGAILKSTVIISEHNLYNGVLIPGLIKVYARESGRKPIHVMRPHNFSVTSAAID